MKIFEKVRKKNSIRFYGNKVLIENTKILFNYKCGFSFIKEFRP